MSADLQNPIFNDLDAAREALEAVRWPFGVNCPHCGNADPESINKGKGKVARPGLYYCSACNGQFTATVGTVFERSKIPLTKWWLAMHLVGSSKKGISAHQIHRMLGVTYKTAWFMCHRIREAMSDRSPNSPLGGANTVVEADETYIGKLENPRTTRTDGTPFLKRGKTGGNQKRTVIGLVERGGKTRLFHMKGTATASTVRDILVRNIDRKTTLNTDESRLYKTVGHEFGGHFSVNHSAGEYVRDDVTTNHIENVFSVFKRGMRGVYQHCGEKHLHRYLSEFEFRYNNRTALGVSDKERAEKIAGGIAGKRLTYRRLDETAHA